MSEGRRRSRCGERGDQEPPSQFIASGSAICTVLSPTPPSLCLREECGRHTRSSSVEAVLVVVVLAFSRLPYLSCGRPEARPGKNSAICCQVRFFVSRSSTSKASSSAVNFSFGPLGLAAGDGMPGWPTTEVCFAPAFGGTTGQLVGSLDVSAAEALKVLVVESKVI